MERTKYILVEWPESQYFIGIKDCYYVQPSINDRENLNGALFVPENIYNNSTEPKLPISNNEYEIWAIDKDGIIIAEFSSFKQADNFKKDYFQILYKNVRTSPVHVYKQK